MKIPIEALLHVVLRNAPAFQQRHRRMQEFMLYINNRLELIAGE
jgi:hypothetical protein